MGYIAALCKASGHGIEVQAFYDPDLVKRDPGAVSVHRQAIEGIGLRSLHGPFGDLCPGSFDAMVREVARHRFELASHIAGQLGVSHVVFHHGYVPGTSSPSGWLSRATTFWMDFLEKRSSQVAFHLENMLEHDPALLSDVIAAVARPNLDLCLDIGHAHCNGKVPVLRWIERMGPQIGYAQLHDNHGAADEHLGLGEGSIPMVEVCHALREYAPRAIWAIEAQVARMEPSLRWLQENGFLPGWRNGV